MTSAMLDEIAKLLAEWTPGPWEARHVRAGNGKNSDRVIVFADGGYTQICTMTEFKDAAQAARNADLIQSSVNNLPELLRLARLGLQRETPLEDGALAPKASGGTP